MKMKINLMPPEGYEKPRSFVLGSGTNIESMREDRMQIFESKSGDEIIVGTALGIGVDKYKNEDRMVIIPEMNFIAAIDGMGGEANGAEAAQILAEELSARPKNVEIAMLRAKVRMEASFYDQSRDHDQQGKGGACFVSARIIGQKDKGKYLEVKSAGDCLLVVFDEDGKKKFVSEMDGFVPEAVKRELISADYALYHPYRNVVTNAVITHKEFFIRSYPPVKLESGDQIAIYTDGIGDNLVPEEVWMCIGYTRHHIDQGFEDVVTSVEERMLKAYDTIQKTGKRKERRMYTDGYFSMPKPDNWGLGLIKIK